MRIRILIQLLFKCGCGCRSGSSFKTFAKLPFEEISLIENNIKDYSKVKHNEVCPNLNKIEIITNFLAIFCFYLPQPCLQVSVSCYSISYEDQWVQYLITRNEEKPIILTPKAKLDLIGDRLDGSLLQNILKKNIKDCSKQILKEETKHKKVQKEKVNW